MATAAQTKANSENAQASTGPQTPEGKLHSSGNSLKFGLFSAKNCVLPEETEEYSDLSSSLWDSLSPLGPVEELFATEIIRSAWRLRRCAATEATLADRASAEDPRADRTNAEAARDPLRVLDPMCYESTASIQAAIDRARTQATGALQHAMTQLRRLQTERWTRKQSLPAAFIDAAHLGLAALKDIFEAVGADPNRKMAVGMLETDPTFRAALRQPAGAKRTQSPALQPEMHTMVRASGADC